jgi:hypothetical protein
MKKLLEIFFTRQERLFFDSQFYDHLRIEKNQKSSDDEIEQLSVVHSKKSQEKNISEKMKEKIA